MKSILILLYMLFIMYGFSDPDPDPERFREEVNAYMESDTMAPPPENCFLFLGSSSIRMWKSLESDFAGYPVVNRGFGGSHFSDAIFFFDELVKQHNPAKIIIYEGDNDIAGNKNPDRIIRDLEKLLDMVRSNLTGTQIAVISAKPSPSRWHLRAQYVELNKKIEDLAGRNEDLTYIDVFGHMLNNNGRPEPGLFLQDSLHMNAEGYKIWTRQIQPFIEK